MIFMDKAIDIWSSVYFIESGSGGPIKIGSTQNVARRVKILQTGNPEKLNLLHWTTGGNALELHLHEEFKEFHIHGEWFRPENKLTHLIDELKAEDSMFGRVKSIVEFALTNGLQLNKDEREILVLLSRGAFLQSDDKTEKEKYWTILEAYEDYIWRYPRTMWKKRRLICWRNDRRK